MRDGGFHVDIAKHTFSILNRFLRPLVHLAIYLSTCPTCHSVLSHRPSRGNGKRRGPHHHIDTSSSSSSSSSSQLPPLSGEAKAKAKAKDEDEDEDASDAFRSLRRLHPLQLHHSSGSLYVVYTYLMRARDLYLQPSAFNLQTSVATNTRPPSRDQRESVANRFLLSAN